MTPIMYHIAVHMMTGQFLVIKGDLNHPSTWEIVSQHDTIEGAGDQIDILEFVEEQS